MTRDGSQVSPFADTDLVMRALVEQPVDPMPAPEAVELRSRIVGSIEAGHSALSLRRSVARPALWAGVVAVAAAIPLVVWTGVARHREASRAALRQASVVAVAGSSEIVGLGGVHPVTASQTAMGPDDELETAAQATARASLPTGAVVDVGPSSHLRFLPMGDGREIRDRVELATGKIDVRVPKLASGSELRVVTQGATVVVHGTRFSVEHWAPDAAGHTGTRVSVTEGRVAVYAGGKEQFLTAGDVWVDTSASPPSTPPTVATAQREVSSSLAIENGLLSDAMSLRRTHQDERSLALLDELISRYPSSPLGETAYVERLRVLADLGATGRLTREAEGYLVRYPDGFARREARQLLNKAKGKH